MTETAASTDPAGRDAPLISRRTLTKAAAWSIPVIALAAPAPAFAASTDVPVTVTAQCLPGPNGGFAIATAPIPVGEQVTITLTHSGAGTFTATPNFPHTGSNPFIVTGTGAAFSGQISVNFTLSQNGTGTVTAVVTGSGGVSGDSSSFVTQRRDGNSQNYNQCSAG
jgi:hypothetical protein